MADSPASVAPAISRVLLFVSDVRRVAAFYQQFFEMQALPGATDKWMELASPLGGCTIALHKSAVRKATSAMKIVFGVSDVQAFKEAKGREGLKLGTVHQAEGFEFANAKDPAGNPIQVSSRGWKG